MYVSCVRVCFYFSKQDGHLSTRHSVHFVIRRKEGPHRGFVATDMFVSPTFSCYRILFCHRRFIVTDIFSTDTFCCYRNVLFDTAVLLALACLLRPWYIMVFTDVLLLPIFRWLPTVLTLFLYYIIVFSAVLLLPKVRWLPTVPTSPLY